MKTLTSQETESDTVRVNDTNSDQFPERIKSLAKEAGGNSEFARRCNVSESVVRSWIKGDSDPSRKRISAISDAFNVNLLWLVDGEGIKYKDGQSPYAEGYAYELDLEGLQIAIEAIERVLERENKELPAERKAQAIRLAYEILTEEDEEEDKKAFDHANKILNKVIKSIT